MKLGQTSAVHFVSKFVASVLGFVATIYFARVLGADALGIYYLVLGVVSWLAIVGNVGVSSAVTKRVSEGEEREQYAAVGISFVAVLFVVLAAGILVFRSAVDSYIGHPAAGYMVLILFVTLVWSIVSALLSGLHLVHLTGILTPVKIGGQSALQTAALVAGLGLTGLFLGYVAGLLLVVLIGLLFAFRRLRGIRLPRKRHYESLFDFAKYSWLGNLESKMFNYTDVIVLGVFVPSALIGIYSIAWNIAMFLILFSASISVTLFPEMSERSSNSGSQAIGNLVEDALSFSGLFLIPGLVGSLLLGERLLRIYGDEFTRGATVLALLIVASLVRAYQKQLLNTLNAIDRPDISFRVNALFVVANVTLNVALIYLYGWVGAAVATVLSVSVSLVFAYHYLRTIVEFAVPWLEIARQWIASVLMGAVVYGGLWLEETYRLLGHNFATVTILVALGAAVYFTTLLAISAGFRTTVSRNLPFDLPSVRA